MPKKLLLIFLSVIMLVLPVFMSCDSTSSTTQVTSTAAQATTTIEPQYGGTLKIIVSTGSLPTVVGYPPEIASSQQVLTRYWAERLNDWAKDGSLTPQLAESWEEDRTNKTLTWHLRKGVNFHDGTPFNAEAARWNIQIAVDKKLIKETDLIESVEVVDDYTVRMKLKGWTCSQLSNYGSVFMYSPTAIEKNGVEWARTNAVATGPFKLTSFERDVMIKLEKNTDYWREGPYLDGIEIRLIPDPVVAAVTLESGQADVWQDISDAKAVKDLEDKGLKVNWGPGLLWNIMPFATDSNLVFSNQKVREAVEYALDRSAIANLMGYGTFEPLTQAASTRMGGYNSDYDPRPYDPEKAKQLLAEAGYPDGFETEILCEATQTDLATILQDYLADVGIKAKIDVADTARRTAAQRTDGWSGLMIFRMGYFPDDGQYFVHFGPSTGRSYPLGLIQTEEFLALWNKAAQTADLAERTKVIQELVKQISTDAMFVPIYRSSTVSSVMQTYVHSDHLAIDNTVWFPHTWWMEKH